MCVRPRLPSTQEGTSGLVKCWGQQLLPYGDSTSRGLAEVDVLNLTGMEAKELEASTVRTIKEANNISGAL